MERSTVSKDDNVGETSAMIIYNWLNKNTIFQDESKTDFSNASSSRKHGGGAAKHLDNGWCV